MHIQQLVACRLANLIECSIDKFLLIPEILLAERARIGYEICPSYGRSIDFNSERAEKNSVSTHGFYLSIHLRIFLKEKSEKMLYVCTVKRSETE